MYDKKAISVLVALSLLIVVSFSSVIAFQLWFSNFQSELFVDIEDQDGISKNIIYDFIGNNLYLKFDKDNAIREISVVDSNGDKCVVDMSSEISTNVSRNNLVLDLDFENVINTTILDKSGENSHGNLSGNINIVSGRFGSALEFDNQTCISVAGSSSVNITNNEITLTGWYKPYNVDGGPHIISKNEYQNAGYAYWLSTSDNKTYYNLVTQNLNREGSGIDNNVKLNQWHFFTLLYNGSGVRVFMDTEEEISSSLTGDITSTFESLMIGCKWGSSQNFDKKFNGIIDEIKVYNRSLTMPEIENLYFFNGKDYLNDTISKISLDKCVSKKGMYDITVLTKNGVVSNKFYN